MVDTFQQKPLRWWYINLESRADRKTHAEEQFAVHGITPQRYTGHLPSEWDGDPKDVARMFKRTPGAVGCYMSQLAVIKSCPEDEIVAVCEDDICFSSDLPARLAHAEVALPEDWDVFYLGATFHVPGEWYKKSECAAWRHRNVDAEPTDDKHIMRVYGQWGTYAYFVNGEKVDKVVAALEENCHRSDGIDHNFMILGDKINAYCFVPGMAWQYDNMSNIGKGMTIFSGFKKLGPYVWTNKMEDFDPDTFNWRTGRSK